MMDDYDASRQFADKYDLAFRRVAGELSFAAAPFFVDVKRAVDMVPLPGRTIFAHRVRSWVPTSLRVDFSIRYSRSNGVKTEYAKIIDGRVPYMLYAWAMRDGSTRDFALWWCIDLHVFRQWATACWLDGRKVPTGAVIKDVPGGNKAMFVCPSHAVLDGFDGLLVAVGGVEHCPDVAVATEATPDVHRRQEGGGPCQLSLF